MNLQQVQNRIVELMSFFVYQIQGSSAMTHTDINRISEVVLIPLFKELFGYKKLKILNTPQQPNYPGIDLADETSRVAFQITSRADNDKIKETLTQFVRNQLFQQYDRLIIYVLTTKQKRYSGKGHQEIVQDKFVFDTSNDIKDYRDLLAIVKTLQIDKARRIEAILEANFGNRTAVRLVEGSVPEIRAKVSPLSLSSDLRANKKVQSQEFTPNFTFGVGVWHIIDSVIHHYLELNEVDILKNEFLTPDVLPHLSGTTLDALHKAGCISDEVCINAKDITGNRVEEEGLWLVLGAAASAMAKNKLDDMLKYSERALRIDPKEHHAWMIRAFSLFGLERHKEALASVGRAIELKEDANYAWFLQGNIQCILRDYEEAIKSFDEGLRNSQVNSEVAVVADEASWFLKGLAFYALSRFDEALTSFDRALELNPNDGHAWYLRAAVLHQFGNRDKAVEGFERALDILPNDDIAIEQILCSYGRLLAQLEQFEPAMESLNRALEINPGNHEAWFNLGGVLTQAKQYEQAAKSFSNVLVLQPDNAKAWYCRGVVYNALLEPDQSIPDFDRALELNSDFSHIWLSRALALLMKFLAQVNQDRFDLAKRDWKAAVDSARRSNEETWYEPLYDILLLAAAKGHFKFAKELIVETNLGESFFPLARALDYVLTEDKQLIETLSPEIRVAVEDAIQKLDHSHPQRQVRSGAKESKSRSNTQRKK